MDLFYLYTKVFYFTSFVLQYYTLTSAELVSGIFLKSDEADQTTPEDVVRLVQQPHQLQHNLPVHIEYACTRASVLYILLTVWTETQENVTIFRDSIRCNPEKGLGLSPQHASTGSDDSRQKLRRTILRLQLPRYIAYRPDQHNKYSVYIDKVVLEVFMVRTGAPPSFHVSLSEKTRHQVILSILEPYRRPHRPITTCPVWYKLLKRQTPYSPTCEVEVEVFQAITFPVALLGERTGVHRALPKFKSKVMTNLHENSIVRPKFTFVMWAYVTDYCPNGKLCSLMQHMTWDDRYATPLLFINKHGQIHVELILENGVTRAYITPPDYFVPLYTWFRLVVSCSGLRLNITVHYGDHWQESWFQVIKLRYEDIQYFDDYIGSFVFGGSELNPSFQGYIGQATIYRRQALAPEQISMPSEDHPMYKLGLDQNNDLCQDYRQRLDSFVDSSLALLNRILAKKRCLAATVEQLFGYNEFPTNQPQCKQRPSLQRVDNKTIPHFMQLDYIFPEVRRMVLNGTSFSPYDIGTLLFVNATFMLENSGLTDLSDIITLLELSSCFGNHDATFMLAAIYNFGLHVKADETQSRSYLMRGALEGNRLCLLALGNKHTFGLDGIPLDLEQGYAYYKAVADMTKVDREEHKADDVFVEKVRLTDDYAIDQHTDESGDLFMWLKYQARQGVFNAQQNMARMLYWGAQGVQRDLNAAMEYYRLAAETGDADALYNYGIVLMKGHGVKKNLSLGMEMMTKAAKQNHSKAINALGWYELEITLNYTKAVEFFHLGTELGNMDAPHNLAHMYMRGYYPGSGVDRIKAWQYIVIGAHRGQLECCILVAMYNMRGHPKISRNPALALSWARYVGEQNPAIGRILTNGVRTYREQNWVSSLVYYLMAASTGVEVASFNLAFLLDENQDLLPLLEKESKWRHYNLSTMRPQDVNTYSFIKMADYHYDGVNGARDYQAAANMYSIAAYHGDPHGLFNLACLVMEGVVIPHNMWDRLNIPKIERESNFTLLTYLFSRCQESPNEEAFMPCTLALYYFYAQYVYTRHWLLIMTLAVISTVLFAGYALVVIYKRLTHSSVPVASPVQQ